MQPRAKVLIDLALQEDAAFGDVTSQAIFAKGQVSKAQIMARQDMLVCGLEIAQQVFKRVDPEIKVELEASDGDRIANGTVVLKLEGPTIALLIAERTALNFLQRLTGIATLARRFADTLATVNSSVRIVDTRKTAPGWRALDKYAVRCGGCFNHRASLSEHVLIKENHITAAGSLQKAVELCRAYAPHGTKIEVEAESLDQVRAALEAGAEIIMLDNMSPSQIQHAVAIIDQAAMVEISGGITLQTIKEYALPGVDVISVGALTHSAPAADFSMIVTQAFTANTLSSS